MNWIDQLKSDVKDNIKRVNKNTEFHNYRLPKAQQYEKEVIEKLKKSKFIVVRQGLEHTHPDFHNFLRQYQSDDPTSLFNRYQPDNIATKPDLEKTCFIEVKYSSTIEKNAYLTYLALYKIGCKVLICIKNKYNEKEYWVPFSKFSIFTATEWENKWNYPIDKDNWFAPRIWLDNNGNYNPSAYYQYKKNTRGSGTPFRYINFEKMKEFQLWAKYRELIFDWLKGKELRINQLYQQKLE